MANYTNTEFMKYDLENHRYVIESALIEKELGVSLDDMLPSENGTDSDRVSNIFLRQLTRDFYGLVDAWSANSNETLFLLSKDAYRNAIQEGLLRLADYRLTYNTQEIPQEVKDFMVTRNILFRGEMEIDPEDEDSYNAKGVDW